jgi:hypothetical protein
MERSSVIEPVVFAGVTVSLFDLMPCVVPQAPAQQLLGSALFSRAETSQIGQLSGADRTFADLAP